MMTDDAPRVGLDHPTVVPDDAVDGDESSGTSTPTGAGVNHPTVVPGEAD